MKHIHKTFFLIAFLFINQIEAQCWFTNLLLDANTDAKFSTYIKNASKEDFNTYKILQTNSSKFVKTNPTYLQKFSKLSPEVQAKIAQFTDDKAGSTLTKFLDDCDDDFIAVLNNPDNAALVKGLSSYKDDVKLTIEELEKIGEQLDLDEVSKLNTWLKRSKDIERFKNYTALGRQLGDNITLAIKDKTSNLFKKLKTELQIDNLEDYDILTEIPLITDGGFMKADIVLIKRSEDGFKTIEDVIILENKLSQGTDFTIRQKEGFGAILNGNTEFKLKYDRAEFNLFKNDVLKISKNRIFKLADHGKADDLDNLSIELIKSIN